MEHLRREKLWVGIGLAFVALVLYRAGLHK
jgi:hypothetical protein